jgi:hypothetical protein
MTPAMHRMAVEHGDGLVGSDGVVFGLEASLRPGWSESTFTSRAKGAIYGRLGRCMIQNPNGGAGEVSSSRASSSGDGMIHDGVLIRLDPARPHETRKRPKGACIWLYPVVKPGREGTAGYSQPGRDSVWLTDCWSSLIR